MKAILQRVLSASVTVDKQLISSIGKGILVLAAVGPDDTRKDAESMAAKVLKMKLWPDESGTGVCFDSSVSALTDMKKWKRSVQDIDGEILCVSQFTLLASTKKGNKPDFHGAAKSEHAKELYEHFYSHLQTLYGEQKVKNGLFQAMMEVGLVNDGPVGQCETLGPVRLERVLRRPLDVWLRMKLQVTLEINTSPPKRGTADSEEGC